MTKTFRPYSLDQQLLLPPDMRSWLPEGDVALFISDVVDQLDLSAIYAAYESGEGRGQPPYHPAMMVTRRESRLATIRAAKAALEAEAHARAAQDAAAGRAKLAAREQRVGSAKGKPAKVPDPEQAQPAPTAQRNFTDPESRIMVDGATKEFVQGYNAQAAVDSHAQVIVACGVTQAAVDVGQFVPMLEQAIGYVGQQPVHVTADAGYFSEANLTAPQFAAIEFYVPPDRYSHTREVSAGRCRHGPFSEAMRSKLQTAAGRAVYARRKTIPEPVFGQIKQARGFRRFWLRGIRKVRAEWALICLTHNLLKLFRARACPAPV